MKYLHYKTDCWIRCVDDRVDPLTARFCYSAWPTNTQEMQIIVKSAQT